MEIALTSSCSSLPRGQASGTERSNPQITGSPGNQPPFLGGGASKTHLINITKDTFVTPSTQEIPRVLGASCQKWERDQIYISYYKSQYHMLPQAKEHQEPPEARRSKEGFSFGDFKGSVALATPFWTSGHRKCEKTHFCCFKPPCLAP